MTTTKHQEKVRRLERRACEAEIELLVWMRKLQGVTAERDTLKKRLEALYEQGDRHRETIHRLTEENRSLAAALKELRRALKPFAKEADRWEPRGDVYWRNCCPFPANTYSTLKIGDLRRARSALQEERR